MTVATTCWYSGFHPYTLEPIFTAVSDSEKLRQRMFFFWYKSEERQAITRELTRMGRPDLLARLYPPTATGRNTARNNRAPKDTKYGKGANRTNDRHEGKRTPDGKRDGKSRRR